MMVRRPDGVFVAVLVNDGLQIWQLVYLILIDDGL